MEQPKDYVNTTRFTSNIAVGGPGGNPYSLFATFGPVVKQVTFYRDTGTMRGVDFERHDSSSVRLGSYNDPTPLTFTFDEDEKITQVLIYSNSSYGNGRFAGLKLTTSKKSVEAFAYSYTPKDSDKVDIPVGNGKWTAIFGGAGNDIDSFGIGMLTGRT